MKNKVLKKALVLMMCGALAVPAAGVTRPMVAHATAGTPAVQAGPTGGAGAGVTTGTEKTPAEQLADAKKNALDQLADYYDALKDSVSADKKADFDKAKKDAEVVATICGDPFIAVGRYGEGKSAVVSTDCSPHWAPPEFCEWKHYNTLVKNLLDFLTEK